MACGFLLSCCWDTFVPVNNGPGALVTSASGKAGPDMENVRREASRPSVPSGTLELYFPDHLYRWVPAFVTSLCPDTRSPTPNLQPSRLGCRHARGCAHPTPKQKSLQLNTLGFGNCRAQQWNSAPPTYPRQV